MLDASGRKSVGFSWGNNFWLGSMRACNQLNNPPKIHLVKSDKRRGPNNLTQIGSKIPLDYRLFYLKHESLTQFDAELFNKSILHVGICLPKSCHDFDSLKMADSVFKSDEFNNSIVYGKVSLISTKLLKLRKNYLNETFVMLTL